MRPWGEGAPYFTAYFFRTAEVLKRVRACGASQHRQTKRAAWLAEVTFQGDGGTGGGSFALGPGVGLPLVRGDCDGASEVRAPSV